VESAKAGDKIVFTGAVLVVPDTSGLSRWVDGWMDGIGLEISHHRYILIINRWCRIGENTTSGKSASGRGADSGANSSGISVSGLLDRFPVKAMQR
jgi:hypothetical protein